MTTFESKYFTIEDVIERSAVSAAETHQTDLTNRDPKQFANRIVNGKGHRSIAEHNVYHINFHTIPRLVAEVIGERRLLSISERSQRRVPVTRDGIFMDKLSRRFFDMYQKLVDEGVKIQDARYVLDPFVTTSMRVTINHLEMGVLIARLRESWGGHGESVADSLALFLNENRWEIPNVEDDPENGVLDVGSFAVDWTLCSRDIFENFRRGPERCQCTIRGFISNVAYQQLKRHRMSSLIRGGYVDAYWFPFAHPVFKQAERLSRETGRIIGASVRPFDLGINFRSLRNAFKERCSRAAQDEIRYLFGKVRINAEKSLPKWGVNYLESWIR